MSCDTEQYKAMCKGEFQAVHGKLDKLEMKDRRWSYLEKADYYACQGCGRRWLYSPDLTCPVLLGEQANK